MRAIFFSFVMVFYLTSCDNEPPFIRNPIFHIINYQADSIGGKTSTIYLSVHYILYDENGLEDIDYVELINIDKDISWVVSSNQLEYTQFGDSMYCGYSFYELGNASEVLLGNYTIKAVDRAGNESSLPIIVELEGINKDYLRPEFPEYEIITKESQKEIELKGMEYHSLEVKVINKPDLYNNSRKKFNNRERIRLSEQELPPGSVLSLRVNADQDERMVYFLKNYTLY